MKEFYWQQCQLLKSYSQLIREGKFILSSSKTSQILFSDYHWNSTTYLPNQSNQSATHSLWANCNHRGRSFLRGGGDCTQAIAIT